MRNIHSHAHDLCIRIYWPRVCCYTATRRTEAREIIFYLINAMQIEYNRSNTVWYYWPTNNVWCAYHVIYLLLISYIPLRVINVWPQISLIFVSLHKHLCTYTDFCKIIMLYLYLQTRVSGLVASLKDNMYACTSIDLE